MGTSRPGALSCSARRNAACSITPSTTPLRSWCPRDQLLLCSDRGSLRLRGLGLGLPHRLGGLGLGRGRSLGQGLHDGGVLLGRGPLRAQSLDGTNCIFGPHFVKIPRNVVLPAEPFMPELVE